MFITKVKFVSEKGIAWTKFFRSLDSDDASTSAGGVVVNGTYNRNTLEDIVKKASSQDQEVQLSAVQQVGHFRNLLSSFVEVKSLVGIISTRS